MKDTIEVLKEDVELFRKKVIRINEDILNPAQKELKDAKQKYAERLCFCEVGDMIQEGSADPVMVSDIYYTYNGYGIRAFKIKENGDKFKYDHDICAWNGFDSWKVIDLNNTEGK